MNRRRSIKLGLLLSQNRTGILVIVAWFVVNFLVLAATIPGGAADALLTTFYFREDPGYWGTFYRNMSGFVIFGLVVSLVVMNLQLRYRPEETCRLLAGEAQGHCLVVGYSHLGQRIVEVLSQQGRPFVVLDPQRERLDDLIQRELPVVIGTGRSRDDLTAASVARASMVVVAEDDAETAVMVSSTTRRMNEHCDLLCRSFDANVGDVLARLYKVRLLSTSATAARRVADYARKNAVAPALIVGANHVAQRIQRLMIEQKWEYRLIDKDEKQLELLPDEERPNLLVGDPADASVLRDANVPACRLVVLAGDNAGENLIIASRIRSMNTSCHVICRVFNEQAEEVLRGMPFHCDVLSTSRQSVVDLVREGVFAPVGLDSAAALAYLEGGKR